MVPAGSAGRRLDLLRSLAVGHAAAAFTTGRSNGRRDLPRCAVGQRAVDVLAAGVTPCSVTIRDWRSGFGSSWAGHHGQHAPCEGQGRPPASVAERVGAAVAPGHDRGLHARARRVGWGQVDDPAYESASSVPAAESVAFSKDVRRGRRSLAVIAVSSPSDMTDGRRRHRQLVAQSSACHARMSQVLGELGVTDPAVSARRPASLPEDHEVRRSRARTSSGAKPRDE